MATSKEIANLVINKVESQAVYNYMVANNLINDDELYLIEGTGEIGNVGNIDNAELITVEDIDEICGASIQSASEVEF